MARLQFCDYHNMVAILEKSEHNIDFYPIVDFVEASPLRIETTKERTNILATVDGILRTVTESSLRRNLKLQDEEGISYLPDAEIFENLTLIGYNISLNQNSNIATALVCLTTNRTYNFSKMIFDGLIKNVNNKGEGSGTPTKPHHTPSPEAQHTSHTTHSSPTIPSVITAPIFPVTSSNTPPIRQYTRRTRIAQSLVLPPVADEHASPLRDVSQGEACPIDSGFEADQDRATIAKTSTLPHDSAPRVTSHVAAEGSMRQALNELMAFCTSLQRQHSELISKFEAHELEINKLKVRVKLLEDREGLVGERSGDDAPIKGRNLDEGEAAVERVSDDTEEMAIVLTSTDASTVLASGVVDVHTGSGSIPTASPPVAEVPTSSDMVLTASSVFATATMVTPYIRRKGKEIMVEYKTLKKKKVQEQIDAQVAKDLEEQLTREDQRMTKQVARDAEIARIHVKEELQSMIDGLDRSNETVAKYQDNYAKVHKFQTQQRRPWSKKQKRDYYMAVIKSNLDWKVKDFREMTFEEIEAKFTTVWKQLEDFIPMGSKEEAERLKRKGLSLEQESAKKLKPSDEVSEEVKSPDEVPEEKFKEMMHLVPIEEVNFHACGEGLPFKEGPGTCDDRYKLQVENYSQMANDLILKIYKIANCPSQQVIEFPLAEEVPTASEESCHCQKKREATAKRIALLDKQTHNVRGNGGNQFGQYARQVAQNQQGYNAWKNGGIQGAQNAVQNEGVQNGGNQNGLVVIPGIANQNGTGNVVTAKAEGTRNENQARCYNYRGLGDLDEIEEVNANCILKANLQHESTSGTHLDKAFVYDTDGSAE
nr:hypothetical protein [Tanacetum cinerariifolium]